MNDKELADKIVALGVGYHDLNNKKSGKYIIDNQSGRASFLTAEQFVSDPRVAMALMEKVLKENELATMFLDFYDPKTFQCSAGINSQADNESLPRAITEACIEAMT